MFKTILLFIKTHAVATIATMVVVGTAVATPIIVENYQLDKTVEASLNLLTKSDFELNGCKIIYKEFKLEHQITYE